MRNKWISIPLILLIWPRPAFSNPYLEELLGNEIFSGLMANGEVTHTIWENDDLTLLPNLDLEEEIRAEVAELKPTVGVEVLTIYESGSIELKSPENMLAIYNILRSISTMKGIEYYSASRGKMRTLFEESYVIDSPESPTRMEDPLVETIPRHSKIYTFQKDLTFGENVYQADYFFSGDYFLLKNLNLTIMWYFIFPMIKEKAIVNYFIIIPAGDKLVFYGLICARTLKFLGLEKSRAASFYNRSKAIMTWFINSLEY